MEDIKIKKCYKCEVKKPLDQFNKCKHGTMGVHGHCKLCQKEIRREWYLKHRKVEIEKANVYAQTDKARDYRKRRWQTHKEKLKPISNALRRTEEAKQKARVQRKNWLQIPRNRIAQTQRGRIRGALKGIAKAKSTEDLIGCSFENLKTHLESKFQPGMTWENYGKWHVDHIKPCASFDLVNEEEQKKCFNYTNLQPLWALDNISKGAT